MEVTTKHAWGEERVYYFDAERRMQAIPRAWTSLARPDPWLQVAAGRSLLRFADCLALVAWVRERSVRTPSEEDPV